MLVFFLKLKWSSFLAPALWQHASILRSRENLNFSHRQLYLRPDTNAVCRIQTPLQFPQLRIIRCLFCPVWYRLMERRFVSIRDTRINITKFDRGHWNSAPKGIFNLTDKSILYVAEARDMKEFRYYSLSSLFARIGFSHTMYLPSYQFSNISNHPGQLFHDSSS